MHDFERMAHVSLLEAKIETAEKELKRANIDFKKCPEPKNQDDILELGDILEAHFSQLMVAASLGELKLFQISESPQAVAGSSARHDFSYA